MGKGFFKSLCPTFEQGVSPRQTKSEIVSWFRFAGSRWCKQLFGWSTDKNNFQVIDWRRSFEGGYAGHIQRFVVRHVSEDYPHGSNLLRLQLVREFLSETEMPHRARIFQNWTYDGRVEANQVFRVRACSLHNFEEVQSGSRFCTNKFDVGIPFQIGGDVDAQELERRNSFDSNSIDDKMRWRSLL